MKKFFYKNYLILKELYHRRKLKNFIVDITFSLFGLLGFFWLCIYSLNIKHNSMEKVNQYMERCAPDTMYLYSLKCDSAIRCVRTLLSLPEKPKKYTIYDSLPYLSSETLESYTTEQINLKKFKIIGKVIDNYNQVLTISLEPKSYLSKFIDNDNKDTIKLSYNYNYLKTISKYKPLNSIKLSCVMIDKKNGVITSINNYGLSSLWELTILAKVYMNTVDSVSCKNFEIENKNRAIWKDVDSICKYSHLSYEELMDYRNLYNKMN